MPCNFYLAHLANARANPSGRIGMRGPRGKTDTLYQHRYWNRRQVVFSLSFE